ncbi:GFA family protein [Sphingomonas zeicaulis]|uniref:GFA family protein n=1 Tax=Sphingomonas zeicaulis TaxID=1632740 RepID=UPI003D19689B
MPVVGGCRCGKLRYTVELEALPPSYACHCLDCQTWSGSAFALHALLPESLVILSGTTVDFGIDSDEAMVSTQIACPACMTRIANRNDAVPGMLILRSGTLDRSDEIIPVAHIWTRRKQLWLDIGDAPSFAETPSPAQFAAALQRGT